ncbi:kynurenine/alpha-aminoadipate aminotransferase, mitochondrial-like [Clavelina lepadiformis]|uniref:kynurenine/alpha-aminoadipate aminotransferase, mitochondrial-like n=1 Tax=Clavelina lepadiformis TaxID=159417 RepID=UPI004041226B
MNFSRFISRVSAARKESPIRETTAIALKNPEILTLAAGWPNPALFPFQSAELKTHDGTVIKFHGKEMEKTLQYTTSKGIPGLLEWVRKLHIKYHSPPLMKLNPGDGGFDVVITSGSQDGLGKVFEMVANSGDNILLDDPCYAGTLAFLRPQGYNLISVATDQHGMRSDSLLKVMQRWKPQDAWDPESDIPKVLYTIPSCGNPTGASATLDRKKEVYKIAQDYDLLIIEDDPYYYLQFDNFIPSYQSIDVDGRVIRSDSMSKVMSSGLRIGWITGAHPFIKRLILHQQTTVIHSTTFGQSAVNALLDQWGMEGFERHIKKVQDFYRSQRDVMIQCMDKHMTDYAEWNVPSGGMFVWMKLKGIEDTTALIKKKALEKKVLLLPGSAFNVEDGKPSSYCRAAYSFASVEVMDEAFRRLAELVQEEWKHKAADSEN